MFQKGNCLEGIVIYQENAHSIWKTALYDTGGIVYFFINNIIGL